jgi:lysine-specific demethylase/histidyl-hydroxylase NO66
MPMTVEALQRCVGDIDRFIDDAWARRPVHYPAADPDAFADLLTLDDVDYMVASMALRLPTFRLIKDGATLPESSYTKTGRAGSKPMTGLADPARIIRLFDQGATIVLQGMHRFWLPLARFCRELEVALGHPTQVNAYVTPPGSQGLAVHEDAHDVFVLQAFGTKHWEVWNTRPPQSTQSAAAVAADDPPAISAELQPGDAVYMPRRTPHAARTQETLSGHLTVGIPSITWRELLKEPLLGTLDAPEFDEPLPAGYHRDRERFAARVDERLAEVGRQLEKADPVEVAMRSADRFLTTRPPILRGALVALSRLASLDDRSVVRRREGSICETAMREGRLTVLLGDRALRMPGWCEPAILAIAERRSIQVSDLAPHLDLEGRLTLVRRLIREGLLEVVSGD